MRLIALILILLFTCDCFSQNENRNIPFGGKRGFRFGLNYETSTNFLRADIGILSFTALDEPFSDQPYEFIMMANHNVFAAAEVNLNHQLIFGPKIGYEINFILGCGRINIIDYFDLKGNHNFCVRPELGLTLLGYCSVSYGYTMQLNHCSTDLSGKHVISLTCNLQD